MRYKQSTLGVGWAIIQPLMLMVVFTFVFGRLAVSGRQSTTFRIPSSISPPWLPWLFFSASLMQAANSLVGNTQLVTKVYFPRLVLPIATVLAAFVDFVIAFAILLVIEGVYGIYPRPAALLVVPAALLLTMFAALGADCGSAR